MGHFLTADQWAKGDLLFLDGWGMAPLEGQDQHDLLELIDDRVGCRFTLVTSQLPVSKWHDTIGDPTVADAMLDRLLQSSTQIQLKGESMRKEKEETQATSFPAIITHCRVRFRLHKRCQSS
ncbi:MAG: ATP-binding protein [Armatimonadetes bacterium]|nr:ATP-binding protein [Armatimonadota bacterium]